MLVFLLYALLPFSLFFRAPFSPLSILLVEISLSFDDVSLPTPHLLKARLEHLHGQQHPLCAHVTDGQEYSLQ